MTNIIMDRVVGQIYETYEYNKFKRVLGNRRLDSTNYNAILKSMQVEQLMKPILVNENFEIIDGQHRFAVEEALGLPVHYQIQEGYGLSEMVKTNMYQTTWKFRDFIESHAEKDTPGYRVFLDITKKYKISPNLLVSLLSGYQGKKNGTLTEEIKSGKMDLEHLDRVIKFLDGLQIFNQYNFYMSTSFIKAYFRLYNHAQFSDGIMADKLARLNYKLTKRSNEKDYLSVLVNDIYAWQSRNINLSYDKTHNNFYCRQ